MLIIDFGQKKTGLLININFFGKFCLLTREIKVLEGVPKFHIRILNLSFCLSLSLSFCLSGQ